VIELKSSRVVFPLLALSYLASTVSAQESLLLIIEDHIGLVFVIIAGVMIVLQILTIFFLQSINEHLNWIRRIR